MSVAAFDAGGYRYIQGMFQYSGEEYDSTVVVPPGWAAHRTPIGFIVLELEQ